MAPQFDSTNPGLVFAKELDVSSILKQCRICGTLGFFQRQLKLIRFTSSKSHAFPKKHSPQAAGFQGCEFLPLFHGMFGFVFGDVCWCVCDFGFVNHKYNLFSGMGSSYPFVSAKLGVAFRSIWRDMINVKMG